MSKRKFSSRLKKMAKSFTAGRDEATKGFEQIPDGKYKFKVVSSELTESSNGNLMAVMECKVLAGEQKDSTFYNRQVLMDNEVGFNILCQAFQRLGYEAPDSVEEVEDILQEIDNDAPSFLGTVKTNGEYTNLRINQALDDEDDDVDEEDEDELEEDADDGSEEEDDTEDVIGMGVIVDIDGTDYVGEVTDQDGDDITVTFEDGDVQDFIASDASISWTDGDEEEEEEEDDDVDEEDELEEEEEDEELAQLEVGNFVEVEGEGEGTVKKIAGNGNLTVLMHPGGNTLRGVSPANVFLVPDDEIPDDLGSTDGEDGDDFPVSLGDSVEAVWDDGETYTAEVVAVYPDGTKSNAEPFFSVKSEDGDRWDINASDSDSFELAND